MATDTPAQVQFLEEHTNKGLVSMQDIDNFVASVGELLPELIKSETTNKHTVIMLRY